MQTATWGANWLVGTDEFKRKRKRKRKTMLARFQAEQYFFSICNHQTMQKGEIFCETFFHKSVSKYTEEGTPWEILR